MRHKSIYAPVLENFKDVWNPLRSDSRRWPDVHLYCAKLANLSSCSMFFILSKILKIFIQPVIQPFLLLLAALLCRLFKNRRWARRLTIAAVILPLLYGFVPLSHIPLQFLENRFDVPILEGRPLDGIIILGGHTGYGEISETRGQPQLNAAAERFTTALHLHRQFPDMPILFTGFSGALVPKGWSENQTIKRLLDDLGMADSPNILFEDTSRNTYENAINSETLLSPQPGSFWVLVTSASHMPRAVGSFRNAGWSGVIPYPVDYQTLPSGFSHIWDLPRGLRTMAIVFHEYVGLFAYWLSGKTDALIPK
ncbi:YdcF family protein [Candidatus Puniceispirillum sp.]|uniref:YdcF family protein n=1 Tax=Candidatus Puniceispirillum sp. TaxID=2026719 RepID=UPI003F6A3EBB